MNDHAWRTDDAAPGGDDDVQIFSRVPAESVGLRGGDAGQRRARRLLQHRDPLPLLIVERSGLQHHNATPDGRPPMRVHLVANVVARDAEKRELSPGRNRVLRRQNMRDARLMAYG